MRSSLFGANEYAARQQAQSRVRIKEVGSPREGARGPPRVIIGEGHVGGIDAFDAEVAPGSPKILFQGDHLNLWVALAHGRHRAVGGGVVHHYYLWLLW